MPKAENDTVLKIKVAILELENELKDHISTEIKDLGDRQGERIGKVEKKADRAHNRLNLLIVALVSSGVLGGGIWAGIKMFMGG